MKQILTYLLEQDLNDLKDQIKDKLDSLDESTLKKIIKIINNMNFDKKQFDQKLTEIGLGNCINDLYRLVNDEFSEDESSEFFKAIIDDKYKFSPEEFISHNNIYKLIQEKNPNISLESLQKIAFMPTKANVNKGDFEVLTQIFMRGIKKENAGHNDINNDKYEFEYKVSGARICGKGTLESPKDIYRKFNELLAELLNANDINDLQSGQSSLIRQSLSDEELDKIEAEQDFYDDVVTNMNNYDFLATISSFKTYFEKLLQHNIPEDTILSILSQSLLKQVKIKTPVTSEMVNNKTVYNDLYNFMKNHSPFKNNNIDPQQFRQNVLVFHIYFYWMHHHFDYITLFSRKNLSHKENGQNVTTKPDGYYVCLGVGKEIFQNFEEIYKQIEKYKIKANGGLRKGSDQESASIIVLTTKNIKDN